MKIIVLVKSVPKETVMYMSGEYTIDREKLTSLINPFDYYAIEEALRIREKNGGEVIVLTLGNLNCEKVVSEVYSLGVDQVILISDSIFRGADTFATSKVIAQAISKIDNVDIVLTGKKSSDGSTSQVTNEVATMLGWNCANNILKCNIEKNEAEIVERYEQCDVERIYSLPVVMSVSTEINVPRIATIDGLIAAQSKSVDIWTNDKLQMDRELCGIMGSKTTVNSVEKVSCSIQRQKQVISDKNQIIESYRRVKSRQFHNKNNSVERLLQLQNGVDRVIVVFCEVCNGDINEESKYVIKKAAQLADGNGACVKTISTTLRNPKRQLHDLSECGVVRNYELQIDNVYTCEKKEICSHILQICGDVNPEMVLFASTQLGMNLAPCFAAMSCSGLTAECANIDYVDGRYLQQRPAFGGRLNANIYAKDSRYTVATVKPFLEPISVKYAGNIENEIIKMDIYEENGRICNVNEPFKIEQKIVIGCGKGVRKKELVELVEKICIKKGYGFCATRDLVDKGWAKLNSQVGLTGKVIAPDIYIAIGISGAYEHVIGVEQSGLILSINLNTREPITEVSDFVYQIDSEEFINILAMEENYE